jgi:hypothetical protein
MICLGAVGRARRQLDVAGVRCGAWLAGKRYAQAKTVHSYFSFSIAKKRASVSVESALIVMTTS